ncbi:MAG: tRNA ((37)-N6)-threonylcarbamoyltransferase complex dimerization subunit type 1 TsaB [Pseudomonadota bacterium]
MTILAIDTSTQWCSVALVNPKGGSGNPQPPLSLMRHENLGPESSQYALDWVEQLLTEANINFRDLDAVAVGIGPGAFTGIRIGVGIGQGMAFAADLPCLPIVCLDAVALEGILSLQIPLNKTILVAIDARMNEVYWASYIVQHNGLPKRVGDICLTSPQDVDCPKDAFYLVGNAVINYAAEMNPLSDAAIAVDSDAVPHARSIAVLAIDALANGLQVSAEDLQPIYVRDKVAQTISERNQVALKNASH